MKTTIKTSNQSSVSESMRMVAGGAWPSLRTAQPRRLPQSTPTGVFFLSFLNPCAPECKSSLLPRGPGCGARSAAASRAALRQRRGRREKTHQTRSCSAGALQAAIGQGSHGDSLSQRWRRPLPPRPLHTPGAQPAGGREGPSGWGVEGPVLCTSWAGWCSWCAPPTWLWIVQVLVVEPGGVGLVKDAVHAVVLVNAVLQRNR